MKTTFSSLSIPKKGTAVVLAGKDNKLGIIGRGLDDTSGGALSRAMKIADFSAEQGALIEVLAPANLKLDRIIIAGISSKDELNLHDWERFGGGLFGKLKATKASNVTLILENVAKEKLSPEAVARTIHGADLRNYSFDLHKGEIKGGKEKKKDKKPKKLDKLNVSCEKPGTARKIHASLEGVGRGVFVARDLVNEPANILYPAEFAARAKKLSKLGVKVEVLSEKQMEKLGMHALLGVGLGSVRDSALVVMQWNGGPKNQQPIAFIGKGVTFDTGGISIKPGAGMGDMKGDMGGAGCVTGLMHALAARKAKANVIGVIALAENMPDAAAQRPGDVVTSMSGQTIEILNTDAEGRLVLADALWYTQNRFKPEFMINLATLTGAILVALGQNHAGLFSNNDELSQRITAAGLATGEKVWRLPLGAEYDKMIDCDIANMKNIGGRYAGSITAAQFLQRFVNDVPWAHLDIAGTAMNSPKSEINRSWGSGFGVRLLNQLVADHYEK
jgi:leucyl aminopeptidase